MRSAPGPIPKKLPDVIEASKRIQNEVVDRPDIRLTDMSIGQLILDLSDGTPTYLTGSHVWLRAIFGIDRHRCDSVDCISGHNELDPNCACNAKLDFDIVLSSKASAERFIERVLSTLNRRLPETHRFSRTTNSFGSDRLRSPDGTSIIDAWYLAEGETIQELVMGYPKDHQRAAYLVNRSPSSSNLVRLVRSAPRDKGIVEALLKEPRMKSGGGYPGKTQNSYPGAKEDVYLLPKRSR